jgi:hypothetical protein
MGGEKSAPHVRGGEKSALVGEIPLLVKGEGKNPLSDYGEEEKNLESARTFS